MVSNTKDLLPPDIFGPKVQKGGAFVINPYPKASASIQTVQGVCDGFGITPFRLGRLLGLPWPHHAYRWVSGERRPSAYYLTLIVQLYQLVFQQGLNLALVEGIDWETGEIIYRRGLSDKGDGRVPSTKRKVSKGKGSSRDPMAQFLDQSF